LSSAMCRTFATFQSVEDAGRTDCEEGLGGCEDGGVEFGL
jgi:hypothetical protein